MKKYLRFLTALLIIPISILFLTGCPDDTTPVTYDFEDIEELTIEEEFIFKTIDTVSVSIDVSEHPIYDVTGLSQDYLEPPFELFAVSSDDETLLEELGNTDEDTVDEWKEDGRLFDLGTFIADDTQSFNEDISIPGAYDLLIIDFKAAGLPTLVEEPIVNGAVSFTYDAGTRSRSITTRSMPDPDLESAVSIITKDSGYRYLSDFNSSGTPTSFAANSVEVSSDLLDDINASLPEYKRVPDENPEFLNNANLKLNDLADVWVTFVTEGAGYLNALGFIATDDADYEDPGNDSDEIDDLVYIFPNGSMKYSGGGLQAGDTVYLGRYASGTTIYWALTAYGWSNRGYNHDGKGTFFSNNLWNPEYDPEATTDKSHHTVLLQHGTTEDNTRFIVGFEDLDRTYAADEDFNDMVFIVTVNPVTAVEGFNDEDVIKKSKPKTDTDGDEISDALDEFPDNEHLAAEQEYSGLVAFEDNWPYKGDYDFNDLVAGYTYTIRTDADNHVRSLQYDIEIQALGAGFKNGLYLKLIADEDDLLSGAFPDDITDPADYTNVFAGTDDASDIVYPTNMDYNGHEGIVLKLIENANVFVGEDDNTILNTDPSYGDSRTFDPVSATGTLYFSADSDLSPADLGGIPFDLFVIKDGDESIEIHLPDVPPSGLTALETFPLDDSDIQDDSNPTTGKYYRSSSNLPWGIHIPASWNYPLEKSDIIQAYVNFDQWAMTAGDEKSDWYIDREDNINDEHIYSYQITD